MELLGKGGMGEVYKARDNLGRIVAVKFVRSSDPTAWMRFRAEARAQGRISHPNVCRIYDADEVEGRPYIAMELVEGKPLNEVATLMSLDDKVGVIRNIVAGIQEAHRRGVIHRDITPSNVLVQRIGDHWTPIITDFGLAREVTTEFRITGSDVAYGTPPYMSPEQARGNFRSVDHRTDIYSLGAILYELLTGNPPFTGESRAEVMTRVINKEPVAPRRLVPDLPIDLEIIALKCMAKGPEQRYASAQELANDLDRYIAGETIFGRRPSLWHRLRWWARRHRSLVALAAASVAALSVVSAFGLRAWLSSRTERVRTVQRTILAERLGRDAKDIELFMRSAYQLPLQDMRPMRALVRGRMQIIAATRHDLGLLGDAVIHDALGRGHLALHEWQDAADELAHAAASGAAGLQDLHAARGRALGELYQSALEVARRSGDPKWIAHRQQQLVRQYLVPALAELAMSRSTSDASDSLAGGDTAYLENLSAIYRGDFAAAEQVAQAAADRAPWRFELYKIAGDAAERAALAAFDHADYETARTTMTRAEELYARASEIARSDASIYEAIAQSELQRAEIDARLSRSPRDALERALETIDKALRADPDRASAYTVKAYVLLHWLRTPQLRNGLEERTMLERIAEAAGRAVDLAPDDARMWDALGNARVFRGNYEDRHGGDGRAWWRLALDDFHVALTLRPDDPWVNLDAGIAHRWIGDSLDQTGQDALPEYQAALRAYQRAAQLDPGYVFAYSNQVDVQAAIAEHETSRGIDPRTAANDAQRTGEQCLTIDPQFAAPLNSMARAKLALARYLLDSGDESGEPLAAARGFLDRGNQLRAGYPPTIFLGLVADWIEADRQMRNGDDPRQALGAAREALDRMLALHQDSADVRIEAARLELVEARWLMRRGDNPASVLARAASHAEKAKELDARYAETHVIAAEACMERARTLRSHEAAARCRDDVYRALDLNPRLVNAQHLRADLETLLQD
jgi:serine/threonine-protein kinase